MKIRDTFMADRGHILIFTDLSRVEDRFVQMYSALSWTGKGGIVSQRMLGLARSRDTDTHALNAKAIMLALGESRAYAEECFEAYTGDHTDSPLYKPFKEYRQKSKKVTHGAQRALSAKGLSERFFEEGLIIPTATCRRMLDAYFDANWEIRDFYFPGVENTLRETGMLVNSWGRRIDWRFHPVDDALLRKAYSFLPQSETADLMNQYGVVRVGNWLREHKTAGYGATLIAQAHDEIIVSSPFAEAYDVACFIVNSLERPVIVRGEPLVVPADVSIGTKWGSKEKLGGLPDRRTFDKKVGEVANESKNE